MTLPWDGEFEMIPMRRISVALLASLSPSQISKDSDEMWFRGRELSFAPLSPYPSWSSRGSESAQYLHRSYPSGGGEPLTRC